MTDPALSRLAQIHAALAQTSLRDFVRLAWPTLEPATPFRSGWHIDAICDHLEAVTRGEITQMVINIPPGCMKSYLVSVLWPSWEWITQPSLRYLCVSYDQALSTRDNMRVRDLVTSEWYQANWPQVQLRLDQNQKTRFDTSSGGWRIGTSIGGRATGEHPHRKIIDDPNKPRDMSSETYRLRVIDYFKNTLSVRGKALNAATILIQQRLHEQDLSGFLLEAGGRQWTQLILPMKYEPPALVEITMPDGTRGTQLRPRMETTPLGFRDPRETPGDLLWPAVWTPALVEEQVSGPAGFGSYGEASQFQQRPAPPGGGIFKRSWFRMTDTFERPLRADGSPQRVTFCRYWDVAATTEEESADPDWTVGTLVAMDESRRPTVVHVERGRWSPAEVDRVILDAARRDPPGTWIREEQEPGASGKAVIKQRTLLLSGFDYKGIPSTGEKTTRWRPFAAQAEAGHVSVVNDGTWSTRDWLDELALAPFGAHDDQCDSVAGAYNALAHSNRDGVAVIRTTENDSRWRQQHFKTASTRRR